MPGRIALVCAAATIAQAQNLGTPPQVSLDFSDMYSVFRLPITDWPRNPAEQGATTLQFSEKASELDIGRGSAFGAWTAAQSLLTPPTAGAALTTIDSFESSTASALNALLLSSAGGYIRVASASITMDQAIEIPRDGITLDLAAAQLSAPSGPTYMLRISGRHNIRITGGMFTAGNSGILVNKSSNIVVDQTQMSALSGPGIVVTGSDHVTVTHNRISGLGGAGILIHGATYSSAVEQNDVSNGTAQSNWKAGILVTDRDVDISSDPNAIFDASDYWPVFQPVRTSLNPPHDSLIAFNHVSANASSGIYVDGGVRMIIFSNTIERNAKEGLCLDYGSLANVVTSNTFQLNGKRWGQPDNILQLDFVSGRLPDGSAIAKLPGISLDNAAYNVIYANNISHNFGGGVKMVRTAYFNAVGMNAIEDNNDGASAYFQFTGVEVAAAAADVPATDLDFTPSRGNDIFSNLIRGSHRSGIYLGGGSDQNHIFNNVIMDALNWAIESSGPMANTSCNNLTNLPFQNISGAGCSPGSGGASAIARPPAPALNGRR